MTAYETTTSRLSQQELDACALIQDLLPLYLEGEVTPASRDLIGEHLSRCERCAGFLAGARSVYEQLQRDTMLRNSSVERDYAARQALITGQRRMMALVLGVFGLLFLSMTAIMIVSNLFSAPVASMPAPMPFVTDIPMAGPDPQLLDPDLHGREMEATGMQIRDPQADQPIMQPTMPPPWPTATPVPAPSTIPAPSP